ncbi:hypothetical protein H0H92_002265 [Tricholoma furcatifolium]|nr:hypothetical protein H0H92_002265 [Tricholoma furcatifolium]
MVNGESEKETQISKEDNITTREPNAPGPQMINIFNTNPVYEAKTKILNDAIQKIGMGRYQWYLFIIVGIGKLPGMVNRLLSDIYTGALLNFSTQIGTGLILTPVMNEFGFLKPWPSLGSDFWGRKITFTVSLIITAIFVLVAGSSPSLITLCLFVTVWSTGIGGTRAAGTAMLLEFVPASHQYLLAVVPIWWGVGQLVGSIFFAFPMNDSPKFLMGRGHDEAAVRVIHQVAKYNGVSSRLTLDDLLKAGNLQNRRDGNLVARFDAEHVKSLFGTKKLAYLMTLLIITWGLIGLAYPLLVTRGADFGDGSLRIAYRNVVREYRMSIKSNRKSDIALTGVFILLSTTARTSNALLGWNCAYSITMPVMYGTLFAITPELLPTKDRGTGTAIAEATHNAFKILSSVIALYTDLRTSVPIFIAGTIFVVAGFVPLLIPFESRGLSSM